MADKLDDAEFWLPSEFLTDEDILMDKKENFNKYRLAGSNSAGLCFPTEFPHDYGSSVLSSPVDSVFGTAETESDEEDLLLTGLTRQLTLFEAHKLAQPNQIHEKGWVLSSSPQSTLTQVGSWSGRSTVSSGSPNGPSQVSSPPTTPLSAKNDAWDLIYQAAGQVARLKMNDGDGPTWNSGQPGPQKRHITPPPPKNPRASTFHYGQLQQTRGEEMLKQAGCGMWNRQVKSKWSYEQEVHNRNGRLAVGVGSWNVNGSGVDPSSCAWPSVQVQQRNQPQPGEFGLREGMRMGSGHGYGYGSASGGGGGGGLKRGRTGTGVFLPRRYGNINNPSNTSDSRKKPGSSPANLHHQSRVMQDWNKMGSVSQTRINFGSTAVYDTLVVRRNALLTQERRNLRAEGSMSHEICLPPEWTY